MSSTAVIVQLTIGEIAAIVVVLVCLIAGLLRYILETKYEQLRRKLDDSLSELTQQVAKLNAAYHDFDKKIAVMIARSGRDE